ncbi:pyruvate ferredoxin oxidoreductase subunit alpha [Pseudodesulfovibrio nedwellii]|uniref:Pyruvate ferredoxin oxidoreductase subunit alpha n=1 Tax=Pseudodesulfovibrio nedwellii TaxID=2973072 RepID=A0ABN6S0B9_9BACT|nr:2-oxoacid:acceptor oxidoreductase subunit alpha [Pseudodesulfovibrio nedwellii]BDQ36389.1 pyruvate ferredoxin oxidoreductase subunit alpha [Pseudodesulfovibrio nedwellii]
MADTSINIVIGGAAGQGLATIGRLLSKGVTRSGYHLLVNQKYMSRVRGGHNTFAIRLGPDPIVGPTEAIDILVALNAETLELHQARLNPDAIVVAGDDIDTESFNALRIPFKELASKSLFYNTVALGVLGAVVCHDVKILEQLLAEIFAKKGDEVVQANIEVLQAAYAWVASQKYDFPCLAPPEENGKQIMVNGNEAIALGAVAAGCNFLSFYPMTPATTVAMSLIEKGGPLGLVYEQVEDEIAAVNMAVGASFAGARAIVTTSGGGFALMVEGVSLAGVSEMPLVCVVVQRPGPATGMATRTEQGDLNLVLYAGHGEFPRAVFAPADPEECFYLTHRAFDLAEKFQTPVFILSDQYLADSYRSLEPFDIDNLPQTARPMLDTDVDDYKRYQLTEDGVSPRLVPGSTKALVRADSHEHDENTKITEDGFNRMMQNTKRLNKEYGLWDEVIEPDYYGDDKPDILLVSWGSTLGACLDAMDTAGFSKNIGVLHFKQVWPLLEDTFIDYLEESGMVVTVEGNATGQFAKLLAQETGFMIREYILRFDGRPMTPEYVLAGLDNIIKTME